MKHIYTIDTFMKHIYTIDTFMKHIYIIDTFMKHIYTIDTFMKHIYTIDTFMKHIYTIYTCNRDNLMKRWTNRYNTFLELLNHCKRMKQQQSNSLMSYLLSIAVNAAETDT